MKLVGLILIFSLAFSAFSEKAHASSPDFGCDPEEYVFVTEPYPQFDTSVYEDGSLRIEAAASHDGIELKVVIVQIMQLDAPTTRLLSFDLNLLVKENVASSYLNLSGNNDNWQIHFIGFYGSLTCGPAISHVHLHKKGSESKIVN